MVPQWRSKAVAAVAVLTIAGPFLPVVPSVAASTPVVPAPTQPDDDGDGIVATSTTISVPVRRLVVRTADGHTTAADRSAVVGLRGGPPMVVFEDLEPGTHLAVRSRTDKRWSPWTEVAADADEAPDDSPTATATSVGPIWVGRGTDAVEVAVLDGADAELTVTAFHDVPVARTHTDDHHQPGGDTTTTTTTTSSTTTVPGDSTTTTTTAVPDDEDEDEEPDDPPAEDDDFPTAPNDASLITPRTAWATPDMAWNCDSGPHEADELRAMIVHHTAGTNTYTRSEVPTVLRGIWRYHVRTRGWCDIAYNFLVDRYGGIWEGRRGGVHRAIIGGHTRGFNTSTSAVAQLGNFQSGSPTSAMVSATQRILGWKLGIHGLDPAAHTTILNRTGTDFRGIPDDGNVPVRTVIGHRDLGTTSCPGTHSYDDLSAHRARTIDRVHVVALHQAFLRQLPAPGQYLDWLGVLEANGLRATAIGMARSAAYSGLIVDDLYQRVLGRLPDDAGRQYWLDVLASGTRVEDVGVQFYGSQEYYDRQGGSTAFVTALYENLLHRAPGERGLYYWSDLVATGQATPADVAEGFYLSEESRMDRVARLYQSILGRGPDRKGQAFWAEQLLDTDDVFLAVDLSLSDEFYERATRTP